MTRRTAMTSHPIRPGAGTWFPGSTISGGWKKAVPSSSAPCLNEFTRSGDALAGCVRPYRVMSTTRTAAVTAVTYRSVRKVKRRPTKHSNAATNANAPHTTHMIHEFMLVPRAGRIDGLSRKEWLESPLIHQWRALAARSDKSASPTAPPSARPRASPERAGRGADHQHQLPAHVTALADAVRLRDLGEREGL